MLRGTRCLGKEVTNNLEQKRDTVWSSSMTRTFSRCHKRSTTHKGVSKPMVFKMANPGDFQNSQFWCASNFSGNAQLTFPVLSSKLWDLRTSSSQPNFRLRFCLAGVPLQMTFANYESTFSKPRMDKNKTTNPFGQSTKRCVTAARSHISKLRIRISRLRTEIFRP